MDKFFPESRFGGFTDIDGTLAFYLRVNELTGPSTCMVDFGCGRGAYLDDAVRVRREARIFKGKAARVIGIDVDPNAGENPFLDEFHLLSSQIWPLDSDSADLCLADMVLEHLENPGDFFSEARRILKSGGRLCIRTSNAWSYTSLAAKLIPNRLHAHVLARVQQNRRAEDVFPTLYRCNSIPAIKKSLKMFGFNKYVVYGYEAEPSYLSFSSLAYRLGKAYGKITPAWSKSSIFCFAELQK